MSDKPRNDESLKGRICAEAAKGTSPAETLKIIRRMVLNDPTLLDTEASGSAAVVLPQWPQARH